MIPGMSKHGNFNEFFEHTKDENVWTNILKQHEEVTKKSTKLPDDDNELELDLFFVSLENEET